MTRSGILTAVVNCSIQFALYIFFIPTGLLGIISCDISDAMTIIAYIMLYSNAILPGLHMAEVKNSKVICIFIHTSRRNARLL